jgi:hypothetical protein
MLLKTCEMARGIMPRSAVLPTLLGRTAHSYSSYHQFEIFQLFLTRITFGSACDGEGLSGARLAVREDGTIDTLHKYGDCWMANALEDLILLRFLW